MSNLTKFRPIFRVYQVFGYAPFSIPFDENAGFALYKWPIYISFLLLLAKAAICHNVFRYKAIMEKDTAQLATYMAILVLLAMRQTVIVILLESLKQRKQHINFLRRLESIDCILSEKLAIKIDYKGMRFKTILWMIVCFTQVTTVLIWSQAIAMNEDIFSQCRKFVYSILLICPHIRLLQITHYSETLGMRFEIINRHLTEMCCHQKRLYHKIIGTNSKSTKNSVYTEIVFIREVYHELWESTVRINKCFKWSLLASFSTTFAVTMLYVYRIACWFSCLTMFCSTGGSYSYYGLYCKYSLLSNCRPVAIMLQSRLILP